MLSRRPTTHRPVNCPSCKGVWFELAVVTGAVRCPACNAPTRISAASVTSG